MKFLQLGKCNSHVVCHIWDSRLANISYILTMYNVLKIAVVVFTFLFNLFTALRSGKLKYLWFSKFPSCSIVAYVKKHWNQWELYEHHIYSYSQILRSDPLKVYAQKKLFVKVYIKRMVVPKDLTNFGQSIMMIAYTTSYYGYRTKGKIREVWKIHVPAISSL